MGFFCVLVLFYVLVVAQSQSHLCLLPQIVPSVVMGQLLPRGCGLGECREDGVHSDRNIFGLILGFFQSMEPCRNHVVRAIPHPRYAGEESRSWCGVWEELRLTRTAKPSLMWTPLKHFGCFWRCRRNILVVVFPRTTPGWLKIKEEIWRKDNQELHSLVEQCPGGCVPYFRAVAAV